MLPENFDPHTVIIAIGGTGVAGKLFIMLARSMPPLPESAGFFSRWLYDLIQLAGENQDKLSAPKTKEVA